MKNGLGNGMNLYFRQGFIGQCMLMHPKWKNSRLCTRTLLISMALD